MSLKFQYVKPWEIDYSMRQEMFSLMDIHYANSSDDIFISDLENKTDVIMLYDSQSNQLAGFSTQKIFRFNINGEEILVLFSGDTIIRKQYWGSLQLSMAFGKLMMDTINTNPVIDFYWMLISKGVRTFKFLPAFFCEYYPKSGVEIPSRIKQIMDALAESMYPEQYDRGSGIIRALPGAQYLREEFQQFEVTGNEDINAFFKFNPGFYRGDELLCLTPLSLENLKPFIRKALERAFPSAMIKKT